MTRALNWTGVDQRAERVCITSREIPGFWGVYGGLFRLYWKHLLVAINIYFDVLCPPPGRTVDSFHGCWFYV